jgi:hypothetical protein
MIELAQCDPDLPGKIDQRYGEGAQGNHEEDGNPALVLNLKERADERNDHHESYRDTADYGPEDRPVQHGRTSQKAWEIGLEPASDGIVVGDPVQSDGSIDNSVQAGNQHRDEGRQRTQRNAGAAACEITWDS